MYLFLWLYQRFAKFFVELYFIHDETVTSRLNLRHDSLPAFRIDIDVELQAACSIVQQHLESGDMVPNTKMVCSSTAASVVSRIRDKVVGISSG